jgi:dTDP-4-amino-4,6-dideoxygalactose transaminase
MVVTSETALAEKVKMLRVHGSSAQYIHTMIGTNSRLDGIQAAVVRVKLKYLDKWLSMRRRNAAYYDKHLKGLPIVMPYVPEYNVHTYHQYTMRVPKDLGKFMKFLIEGDIETRTYYPVPLHLQECYRHLKYKQGDMKAAEEATKKTCAIPVYPELTEKKLAYIVGRIKAFFTS